MSTNWSTEEIEYLKDRVGFVKLSTIANNLGRSYTSVNLKTKRLSIYNTKNQTGMLTMHELAKILGVDRNTVKGWVERDGLICHKKITKEKRTFFLIRPSDFWEWAELHKEKVQFRDIEPHILAPEPYWVNVERRREMELSISKKRKYQPWTTLEDKQLVELRNKGLTYKEIGKKMNRSPISVERRYNRIKSLL